jgi:hypothetical protein
MFSCVRSWRSFICTILRSKVDARYHVTLEITRMESDIVNRNAAFVLSDSCGVNSIANRLIRELEKLQQKTFFGARHVQELVADRTRAIVRLVKPRGGNCSLQHFRLLRPTLRTEMPAGLPLAGQPSEVHRTSARGLEASRESLPLRVATGFREASFAARLQQRHAIDPPRTVSPCGLARHLWGWGGRCLLAYPF